MGPALSGELSRLFLSWLGGDRGALDGIFCLAGDAVVAQTGVDYHSIPVRFATNHHAFEPLMAEHFGSFRSLVSPPTANIIHLHVPEPLLPVAAMDACPAAVANVKFPAFGPEAQLRTLPLAGGWLLVEDSGTLIVVDEAGGRSLLVTIEGENLAVGALRVRQGTIRFASRLSEEALLLAVLQEFLAGFHATLVHAACVERDGRGVLIMAPERRGKSTTTLSLVRAGWKMLSDDRTLLRRDAGRLALHSFPERSRIGARSVAFFPELTGHVSMPVGDGKAEFTPEEVWGDIRSSMASPTLLVIPEVVHEPLSFAERVRPLGGIDDASELVADNLLRTAPSATIERFSLLCELFSSVPMIRLRVGPGVEQTADQVDRLVKEYGS